MVQFYLHFNSTIKANKRMNRKKKKKYSDVESGRKPQIGKTTSVQNNNILSCFKLTPSSMLSI